MDKEDAIYEKQVVSNEIKREMAEAHVESMFWFDLTCEEWREALERSGYDFQPVADHVCAGNNDEAVVIMKALVKEYWFEYKVQEYLDEVK